MWPHMGSMGSWMVLWWGAGVLILVALVWLLVRAAEGSRRVSEETPEQLLKRRYARGEIEREEYQRRLEDLRR